MFLLLTDNSQAARDCSHTSLDQITEQSTDPTLQVPTADGSYVTVASDMHIVERRQRPRDNSKDRRRKSPGPFSRMFGGKTRSRRSIAVLDPNDVDGGRSHDYAIVLIPLSVQFLMGALPFRLVCLF